MAMLCTFSPSKLMFVNDAEVVFQIFPDFWKDMENLKIKVQNI